MLHVISVAFASIFRDSFNEFDFEMLLARFIVECPGNDLFSKALLKRFQARL